MGVERSVTRWYLHRQMILNEIASIEERLRQLAQSQQEGEQASLQHQLSGAQKKLRDLGACPKPMMG